MFHKFSSSTDVTGQTPPKSSVQRSIRAAILSQWKIGAETLEQIWPKKESLIHVKCKNHVSIYTIHGEPLFFQQSDGPIYPTLRLLHKYPFVLPRVGIDRGAIRFLLSGANMMCPGLTSTGGYLPPPGECSSRRDAGGHLCRGKGTCSRCWSHEAWNRRDAKGQQGRRCGGRKRI
ncbi:hypothetical protein EDD17DRAFT_1103138 [Pisolithus thermaeus]|nr:hypothetical protein EDD17DRAFT_1103138 [Pisolithus thermaeus]